MGLVYTCQPAWQAFKREEKGSFPRAWSRALIPFLFPFERLPRRLYTRFQTEFETAQKPHPLERHIPPIYMAYIMEYPLLQGMGQSPQQPEMPSSSLTFIDKFFDRVYFVLLEISCTRTIHFKTVMLKKDKDLWNVICRILKQSLDLIRLDTNVLKDSLRELP